MPSPDAELYSRVVRKLALAVWGGLLIVCICLVTVSPIGLSRDAHLFSFLPTWRELLTTISILAACALASKYLTIAKATLRWEGHLSMVACLKHLGRNLASNGVQVI